jgi:AcrR family transcriptional regulator
MAIRSEVRRALDHARASREATERAMRAKLRESLEHGRGSAQPDVVWLRLGTLSGRARRELDRIVAAAIDLADREGLDALSMRRLAGELDTGTTTIYRYVTGRDELLELMVDAVNGSDGNVTGKPATWRAGLELVAREARARLLAHPWLASQLVSRPTIGPNTLRGAEFVISIAIELTGDATTAAAVASSLMAFVQGSVFAELAEQAAHRRSGLDERAWRETVAPWVQSILGDAEFPAISRVIVAADELTFDERFEFGLARLLDGFELLADGRSARAAATGSAAKASATGSTRRRSSQLPTMGRVRGHRIRHHRRA